MNNKDKEALKNEVKQTSHGISVTKYNKELVRREFEKLQDENAKLRECVEFYAGRFSWTESKHPTHEYYAGAIIEDDSLVEYTEKDGDVFRDYSGGKRARKALAAIKQKR